MARLLLLTLLAVAAFAQQHPQQPYLISIGDESSTIPSGTVWLYSLSGYGVHGAKLAQIENGRALMPSDIEEAKRELNPNQTAEVYVLAVQVGEHLWYRTPNISREVIWTDLAGLLNSLGQSTALQTGGTRLILPTPTKHHITMLYPGGRPAANADVEVSVYFFDLGHCGGHEELPLGNFRTDQNGAFTVQAPLVPLFLDNITYFGDEGSGPAGAALSYNTGLKLGPEETVVLKQRWELTPDDYLLDDFELRVLTAKGSPLRGVDISWVERTNLCGGGQHWGETDARGMARMQLIPEVIESLTLSQANSATRVLTESELRTLFSGHKLTIRW